MLGIKLHVDKIFAYNNYNIFKILIIHLTLATRFAVWKFFISVKYKRRFII